MLNTKASGGRKVAVILVTKQESSSRNIRVVIIQNLLSTYKKFNSYIFLPVKNYLM